MKRVNYKTEFYDLAKEAHGSRYDYSLVTNTDTAKTKIEIICPIHGQFTQTISRHCKDKRGCPDCGVAKRSKSHTGTTREFIIKAKRIHGNKYDYSLSVYVKAKVKTTVICKEHGEFMITPNNHLFGKGCSLCGNEARVKHGMSGTRIERVLNSMLQRCNNSSSTSYKNYGGRGIEVCNAWTNNKQNFFDWAMSNGYAEGLSIDRIDNNGNYEPSNCRWATATTQAQNTRRSLKNRFSDDERSEIAELYANTDISKKQLAKQLGVDESSINKLL